MRVYFSFILVIASVISYAQGLKVTDVKESVSGSDAFHAPIDKNGHPCGLVKIQTMIQDLRFGGDVDGDFTFENNEYKVYLAKGSKQLVIKRSQVMPIVVNFPDFGIGEISSKATYIIKLKEVSLNATKNLLVIDVKPRTATVYIDDLLIDDESGDGGYRLLLPKGEHLCKVECKGYRSYASVFKSGKETQVIKTELESLLADVEINSLTSGSHIIIDGEEVGVGSWKGKLPAGTYKVDVLLEGFISSSQSIVLEEKDNRTISIPQLKRAKGNIVVLTNNEKAIVYLDGKRVDDPHKIRDIQTGIHKLNVRAPFGYKEVEKEIIVHTKSSDTVAVKMEPINDLYAKAFSGDISSQAKLCQQKMESSKHVDNDTIERNYWFEIIDTHLDKLDNEHFRMVCPNISDGAGCDFSQAGMYTYFSRDPVKGLEILYMWNKIEPEDDSVVLEITGKSLILKDYDSVVKWGTRGLDICSFEGYMGVFMSYVAEACVKQGNVNRAITLFKNHIKDWYEWQYGYITIGDVYKELGDGKNAIFYYERFLKEVPNAKDWEKEDVKKKIKECR